MYRLFNNTSERFTYDRTRRIEPGTGELITNNPKDIKIFESAIGTVQIKSRHVFHFCKCDGNIVCTPEQGRDGMTFTLREMRKDR